MNISKKRLLAVRASRRGAGQVHLAHYVPMKNLTFSHEDHILWAEEEDKAWNPICSSNYVKRAYIDFDKRTAAEKREIVTCFKCKALMDK